jgi:hypothetical protein
MVKNGIRPFTLKKDLSPRESSRARDRSGIKFLPGGIPPGKNFI